MSENSSNTFHRLRLTNWRQFADIDIELHNRLTVITGANGAGKSTLIRIFSRHFGYDRPILATPKKTDDGALTYLTGLFTEFLRRSGLRKTEGQEIGNITYNSGAGTPLKVPASTGSTYSLSMDGQEHVHGTGTPPNTNVMGLTRRFHMPPGMCTSLILT